MGSAADNTLASSIDLFLDWLATVRQYSPHTINNYRLDLHKLQAFANSRQITDAANINTADIRQWAARLHRDGLGGKSIQRALSSV
ncbi:MAG TPA: site-specific integrase, partial [Pseudomonadales bacterium]